MAKRIGIFVLGATIAAFSLEVGAPFLPRAARHFVATLEAIIGRPLTPLSVAGVARRTSRRCAVGVYDC
jgi:hypothetical protein